MLSSTTCSQGLDGTSIGSGIIPIILHGTANGLRRDHFGLSRAFFKDQGDATHITPPTIRTTNFFLFPTQSLPRLPPKIPALVGSVSSMIKCFLGQQSYNKSIVEPYRYKDWTFVMHLPPSPYLEAKLPLFDFDSSVCSSMEAEYLTSDVSDTNDDDSVQVITGEGIEEASSGGTASNAKKRRCIWSDVYEYFENLTPNGVWDQEKKMFRYTYKCRHCSVATAVLGRNTSNLNKHQSKCCGQYTGSIDPNLGAKLAAKEQEALQRNVVEAVVASQLSFSVFKIGRLCTVLSQLAPSFIWPKHKQMAAISTQLYFERKQELIEEITILPNGTSICTALDFWTTKDQSQSYLAVVGQWIDPIRFTFCRTLLLFETLTGAHTGQSLAWSIWESLSKRGILERFYSITGDNAANNLSMIQHLEQEYNGLNIEWPHKHRFHRCACHVINLVAKEFLSLMGKLNEEDYKFFNDYLAISRAPIDDSEDEEPLSAKEVQATISKVKGNKRITARSKKQHPLNQTTLETQDQLEAIELITSNNIAPKSEIEDDPMPSGRNIVQCLRALCSHIRGSAKQRDAFIQARNKTRDPRVLPISIPMTRWNYFLHQIQRAQ
ncbi:hypothetical protein O181_029895 [Austropuccinia psidii MF-1]|uniref:BED-type domain-containing protein n=1 Tax=Austropuccinia psidii MF-1 TaxID=1389203 RepID=A0A9Q3H5N2_9BASI|nr:hypothetical protein [Austropuccinia psidii MF-1]